MFLCRQLFSPMFVLSIQKQMTEGTVDYQSKSIVSVEFLYSVPGLNTAQVENVVYVPLFKNIWL